jgi:hypothetical protein
MTDLAITNTLVVPGTDAVLKYGTAGETIAAGKAVYLNTSTKKYMLADANVGTAENQIAVGIAVNGASLNQPITVQSGGDMTTNAIWTAGTSYYLSGTAGGIAPFADITTGYSVCQMGIAKSTTVFTVKISNPGVTL